MGQRLTMQHFFLFCNSITPLVEIVHIAKHYPEDKLNLKAIPLFTSSIATGQWSCGMTIIRGCFSIKMLGRLTRRLIIICPNERRHSTLGQACEKLYRHYKAHTNNSICKECRRLDGCTKTFKRKLNLILSSFLFRQHALDSSADMVL